MQSALSSKFHAAIIMDGNGRWAAARGLPRTAGHEAGVRAIRRTIEAAPRLGVGTLTLYAFSSDNWRRPQAEVEALMGLLRRYLSRETARLARNGVRLTVIGRRDRLPGGLAAAIARAEAATASGEGLHLRIAVDYSARDAILSAAARIAGPADLTCEGFSRLGHGRGRFARRSICSSAPAGSSASPTSSCGKAPMPNSISRNACGRTSARPISPRRWTISGGANAGSAASPFPPPPEPHSNPLEAANAYSAD